MENHRNYIPINCWKCGKMNNSNVTEICIGCGVHLKTSAKNDADSNLNGGSFFDFELTKSSLIAASAFIGFVIIFFILSNIKVPIVSTSSTAKSNSKPVVTRGEFDQKTLIAKTDELPSNSWYKNSFWSYIRKYPTANQIFSKNTEVSGNQFSTDNLSSIYISGKLSLAQTNAVANLADYSEKYSDFKDCYDVGPYFMAEREKRFDFFARTRTSSMGSSTSPRLDCNTLEKFLDKPFHQVANVEIFADKSGKSLKKAVILDRDNLSKSVAETSEGFDGVKGWKKTLQYNPYGNIVSKTINEMGSAELADLKNNIKDIWIKNYYNNDTSKVTGLAKINSKTAFIVESVSAEDETLYFDTVSGFLLRMDRGDLTIFFDDYKDFEGSMMPYTLYYRKKETKALANIGGLDYGTDIKLVYFEWIRVEISVWDVNKVYENSMFEMPIQ